MLFFSGWLDTIYLLLHTNKLLSFNDTCVLWKLFVTALYSWFPYLHLAAKWGSKEKRNNILSMDTFLFSSLYKDIMDQPIDLQSHTQSPQAFWSAGGRQERLWRIRKNLNFLTGCPVAVCIVLPQISRGNKIPIPQSLSWRQTAGQRA